MLKLLAVFYKWLGIAILVIGILGGCSLTTSIIPTNIATYPDVNGNGVSEPGFGEPKNYIYRGLGSNLNLFFGLAVIIVSALSGVSLMAASDGIEMFIEIHETTINISSETMRLRDDLKKELSNGNARQSAALSNLERDMKRAADALDVMADTIRKRSGK